MKQLVTDVFTALKTITEIKWIDMDLGQLDFDNPPVAYPCTLFRYDNILPENPSGMKQDIVRFTITYADKVYERAVTSAPPSYKNKALAHLDVIKKIRNAVEDASHASYSFPECKEIIQLRRIEPRMYEIVFECVDYEFDELLVSDEVPDPDITISVSY